MFRQAHIQLAQFLAGEMQSAAVNRHRGSLYYGSILPDSSFRMRMKDHEFDATWEDTKDRIKKLMDFQVTGLESERDRCREIGIVLHYLADYFTCPHNPSYGMGLMEHGYYEGNEALALRVYLRAPKAEKRFLSQQNFANQIHSQEQLFHYIERMHDLYLQEQQHTPSGDCRWILDVCACAYNVLAVRERK